LKILDRLPPLPGQKTPRYRVRCEGCAKILTVTSASPPGKGRRCASCAQSEVARSPEGRAQRLAAARLGRPRAEPEARVVVRLRKPPDAG
jgi:hypothetical protein